MSTDSVRWQDVLDANPGSREGAYNPARKTLLEPGVFVDVQSRLVAAGWVPTFMAKMKADGENLNALAPRPPDERPVRVTIVEIPEETRNSAMHGPILVEVEGVRGRMDSSVFSNCISNPESHKSFVSASGESLDLMGDGTALPTRGEGSHSSFHRR
ncbi:MAG: hypothetical protein AAB383_05035 [Patescibacteria group bacterium]